MSQSSLYNANDFTLAAYKKLLQIAKQNYNFIHYDQVKQADSFVLWRHDIDYSVENALVIAKLEAEFGLSSTYFIHLHSAFYNAFEKEITAKIKQIANLNHKIGLHFDCDYYNINQEKQLDDYLLFEKNCLQKLLEVDIAVFSFHNTTPFTESCTEWSYGTMINTYAAELKSSVEYCSDSNGYWRYKRLDEVLNNRAIKKLQVLTHPAWWTEKPLSPREKISHCINSRAEQNNILYDATLEKFQRVNIR